MTYQFLYHAQVVKYDIPNLGKEKSRIQSVITQKLSENPLSFGKPLRRSLKGYRRLRIGNYRVIYKVSSDSKVYIAKIGLRSNVYKEAVMLLRFPK